MLEKQLTLCATAIESLLQSPGLSALAATTEARCAATGKTAAMRSPCTAMKSTPAPLVQLEKGLGSSEDPAQPKINKRRLLLGRKAMTNLDSVLKSRDITLPTKICIVKAVVLPVVMYGCESWTTKKAECRRIDAFKLWCWRRLLRVLWTAKRSKLLILKEINTEYSVEGLILKQKLNTLAT